MNRSRPHWLFVALLVLGAGKAMAQPDRKTASGSAIGVQDEVTFHAGWAPAPTPLFGGCDTYLIRGIRKGKDGVPEASGAQTFMLPRSTLWVMVNYPPLRMNDTLPVFGRLFRVVEMNDRGEPKGNGGKDSMVVRKADENTLPPGLTFQEGAVVVPLNRDGVGGTSFDHGMTRVFVAKIELPAPDDKGGPVAEIKFYDYDKSPSLTLLKLRRGDTLPIRKAQYKVLNVIPRDEKTHVIGWVELAP